MYEVRLDPKFAELHKLLVTVDKDNPSEKEIQEFKQVLKQVPEFADDLGDIQSIFQNELVRKTIGNRSFQLALLHRLQVKVFRELSNRKLVTIRA